MERLSERQEEILRWWWEHRKRRISGYRAPFGDFASAVLEIEVTLDIGGRATLRHPKESFRVESYWLYDRVEHLFEAFETRIVGEPGEGFDAFATAGYFAELYYGRLWIELEGKAGEFGKTIPRKRPKVGQPLDADFYRRVLALRNQFEREGHPAPGKAVAERMHANPGTVRTWLKRARDLEKSHS